MDASVCSTKYEELITLIDIYFGCRVDGEDRAVADDGIRTVKELLGKSCPPTVELVFQEVVRESVEKEISDYSEIHDESKFELNWSKTAL